VNVRNGGALPYLEADEVAEIACRIGRDGAVPIRPAAAGTPHMVGLIRAVKLYERLAVEAALTGSRETALAALMQHPLIGDYEKARDCFDALLRAHARYLPAFVGEGSR